MKKEIKNLGTEIVKKFKRDAKSDIGNAVQISVICHEKFTLIFTIDDHGNVNNFKYDGIHHNDKKMQLDAETLLYKKIIKKLGIAYPHISYVNY